MVQISLSRLRAVDYFIELFWISVIKFNKYAATNVSALGNKVCLSLTPIILHINFFVEMSCSVKI